MNNDEVNMMKELDTFRDFLQYISTYKDRPAVKSSSILKTYNELLDEVSKTRGFLHNIGVKEGERVAIHMQNDYDFLRLFLALVSYGAVAVLIPAQTPPKNLSSLVKKMDIRYYFTNEILYEIVGMNVTGIKLFKKELLTMSDPHPVSDNLTKDNLAALLFSSQSLKTDNAVMLSHGNFMRGIYYGVFSNGNSYYQRYLNVISFAHAFGLIRGGLTPLYTGSLLYVSVNQKDIVNDLSLANPTYMVLFPEDVDMLFGLVKTFAKERILPALRIIIVGGSLVNSNLSDRFAAMGVSLLNGYELTEASGLISLNLSGKRILEMLSAGIPYPKQGFKIDDDIIYLKGDNVFLGYYKEPALNEKILFDGWFNTGVLGKTDEDGYLYILGRSDNLIIRKNGEKVIPEALEAKINTLPYIKDSLVRQIKNASGSSYLEALILTNDPVVKAMGINDVFQKAKEDIEVINQKNPSYMAIDRITIRKEDFRRR